MKHYHQLLGSYSIKHGRHSKLSTPYTLSYQLPYACMFRKILQDLDVAYSVEALQLTLNEWKNLLNSHSTNECNVQRTESDSCQSSETSVCQYWKDNLTKMNRSSIEALSLLSTQVFEVCVCGTHKKCEESTPEAIEFIQQFFPILNIERVRQALVNSNSYTYDCWCVLTQGQLGILSITLFKHLVGG